MLSVVLLLIVIGVILWVVNTYVPMDAKIKNLLNIFVVICVVFWLLNVFGVLSYVGSIGVPRVHR